MKHFLDIIILHQGRKDDQTTSSSWNIQNMILKSLQSSGYRARPLFVDDEFRWAYTLQQSKKEGTLDLVFNVADLGLNYNIDLEPHIPMALEALGVPFTGSSGLTLASTIDKYTTKIIAHQEGILVPAVYKLERMLENNLSLPFPLIIKQRSSYGSRGITLDSVVESRDQLYSYAQRLRAQNEQLSSWIGEEYLESGRHPEATCGFLGNSDRLFFPFGIEFGAWSKGKPRIRDYDSKFDSDSPHYGQCTFSVPLNPQMQYRLKELSEKVASLFNIRDYGRFDFRFKTTPNGSEPYLIDINSNPDLNDDGSLFLMAAHSHKMDYSSMINRIVEAARERYEL